MLTRHSKLVRRQLLEGNAVIVKALAKPVPNCCRRVVQNRVAHEPAFQAEVKVFNAPIEHVGIEAPELLVEGSAHRQGAPN